MMPDENEKLQTFMLQRLQAYAGLMFIAMAVVSFGAAVFFIVRAGVPVVNAPTTGSASAEAVFLDVMRDNSEATFLILGAVLGSLLGASLLRSALHAARPTISDEDRDLLQPLIQGANEDAINQFVRISSLTGSTGFFTKLGFTGLPLVTAALGLILIFLAMLATTLEMKTELMDLAKLVIGAFIGSFVQRKVGQGASDDKIRPENLL